MLSNTVCTLYAYNKATGGFYRRVIPNVYWCENKAGNVLKSGLQTSNGTTIYFYDDKCMPLTVTKDMLVKGICPFEFNNTSPQTISESMKTFGKAYDFVTVTSVDNYMFGGNPHVEVSVK